MTGIVNISQFLLFFYYKTSTFSLAGKWRWWYHIFRRKTCVCAVQTKQRSVYSTETGDCMSETNSYYIVKQKALPEVLLKVVEAKSMLDSEQAMTIQDATDKVGISRSSFYKYKDDIFQFHDNTQGKTITLTFSMDDKPGLLADLLKIIAKYGANILTIHQSIPINAVASLSISVQVLPTTKDVSKMIDEMEQQPGVHHVKILAKE